MKFAACYIVKNEAENLRKSLESVKSAVDEIVVVDTGSQDNTVEVAQSLGAKLFFYQWNDHFADARNFALAQVETPWVIFLDADEAFMHPGEVRPALEEYLRKYPGSCTFLVVRYDIDRACPEKQMGYSTELRIFRNMPELRYAGRIHEHLTRIDSVTLEPVPTDERLAISHTGYSSDCIKAKAQRNLELLMKDVEEAGGIASPLQNGFLAAAYHANGDYQKALECVLLSLETGVRLVGQQGNLYQIALDSMEKLHMPSEDMLALSRLATKELPDLPEFHAGQGMILSSMGRLEEAKRCLEKAIAVFREHPVNWGEASVFSDAALVIVYRKLGKICHLQGDDGAAEKYFRRALEVTMKHGGTGQVHPERKGKPYLSVCYIVRNEADNLARSLESIQGEADELLVVDTGSTDATVAMAKAHDARVLSFKWVDDFSAARNFALKHVRGEWVLFLDADEYFSEKTGGRIRELLEQNEHVDQFLLFWRNIDGDTGEVLLDSYAPRLFRNRRDFRYVGRIHEELRQNGEVIKSVAIVPEERFTLMHTGYSVSVNKKKAERNLALLLEELKTSKHPEWLYMYLAEAYDGVGDEENAILYATRDIATGKKSVIYASRSYRVLLRLFAKCPEEADRRLQAAEWAVRDFPEIPEFHAEYAECLAQHGKFREALEELEKAEEAFGNPSVLEPVLFPEEMRPMLAKRREYLLSKLEETEAPIGMKGKVAEGCKPIIPEVSKIQERELLLLLEVLFHLEGEASALEVYNSCKGLLSPTLRDIWNCYETGNKCIGNMDEYRLILSIAVVCADDSQLLRYVDLLESTDANQIYEVGNCLMEGERWQSAFSCYAMIPMESDCVCEEFWYRVGRCLYHLGELAGAEEFLKRALKLSPDYFPAKSFLQWCRKGK